METIIIIAIVVLVIVTSALSPKNVHKPADPTISQKPQRQPLTDAEQQAILQANAAFDFETSKAIKSGTYNGPLPEHIAFSMWTNIYPNLYNVKIAGINFRKGIKELAGQYFSCYLEADPKNKYDQNAIKIMHADGRHIGFIPANETEYVSQFINDNFPYMDCKGHIDEGEEYDENDRIRHFLYGTINIQKPS